LAGQVTTNVPSSALPLKFGVKQAPGFWGSPQSHRQRSLGVQSVLAVSGLQGSVGICSKKLTHTASLGQVVLSQPSIVQ